MNPVQPSLSTFTVALYAIHAGSAASIIAIVFAGVGTMQCERRTASVSMVTSVVVLLGPIFAAFSYFLAALRVG